MLKILFTITGNEKGSRAEVDLQSAGYNITELQIAAQITLLVKAMSNAGALPEHLREDVNKEMEILKDGLVNGEQVTSGVAIVWDGKVFRPVVYCDFCNKPITNANDGNYEWKVNDDGGVVDGRIFYTHKHCCLAFESANGGRGSWFCDSLSILPLYMENNLHINRKDSEKTAWISNGFSPPED